MGDKGEALAAMSSATAPKPDSGLVSLALVARFHGKAAEADQLRHELGLTGAARAEDLLLAAKRLELKAKLGPIDLDRAVLGKSPLPCIVELTVMEPGGEPQPDAPKALPVFAVLAKLDAEKALLHDPAQSRAVTIPIDELRTRLTGRALFLTSRASLAAELARFDFTWFVPAIVKYRKLIGEALLASLFLQLFALVTPLFFQVVIDKVLVHKGYSTLTVIAIGLLAAVIFESVLSALRTYVFAHTTSRIDVELGARLFRHLLGLPLAYFEARRVGDSVARVSRTTQRSRVGPESAVTVLIVLSFESGGRRRERSPTSFAVRVEGQCLWSRT